MNKSDLQAIRDILRQETSGLEQQYSTARAYVKAYWEEAVPNTGYRGKASFLALNQTRDEARKIKNRLNRLRSLNKKLKVELNNAD